MTGSSRSSTSASPSSGGRARKKPAPTSRPSRTPARARARCWARSATCPPSRSAGCPTDHRSDLFSFGAVLFEMVTGRRAFKGTTAADTLSAILREDPTESFGDEAGIPPGLLRVVRRCLEKSPDDRFQTARDLAFADRRRHDRLESPRRLRLCHPPKSHRLIWRSAWAAAGAPGGSGFRPVARPPPRRPSTPPTFQKLTFRIGNVDSAVFAPDGETILYSARWARARPRCSPLERPRGDRGRWG